MAQEHFFNNLFMGCGNLYYSQYSFIIRLIFILSFSVTFVVFFISKEEYFYAST